LNVIGLHCYYQLSSLSVVEIRPVWTMPGCYS